MKRKMYVALAVAALLLAPCAMQAKPKDDKNTESFRYEIECAGNGTQGTYLVKVWTYTKKVNKMADVVERCKKNTVHGIIFKGYTSMNGCVAQRALAQKPGVEMEYKEYFENFFKDYGEYLKYVSLTSVAQETIKVGKEYKVGVVVSVQKDELRRALEAAGVISGLGRGF